MARTPSLLALLGIAAVAGYQNRDKLGQMLGGGGTGNGTGSSMGSGGLSGGGMGGGGGLSDLLSGLGGGSGRGFGDLGAAAGGGGLAAGLRDLMENFSGRGQRDVAESWVGTGQNRSVSPSELEASLGPDVIEDLAARTGLGREELLQRLSVSLPETVDRLTPDGRLPES